MKSDCHLRCFAVETAVPAGEKQLNIDCCFSFLKQHGVKTVTPVLQTVLDIGRKVIYLKSLKTLLNLIMTMGQKLPLPNPTIKVVEHLFICGLMS